ncbi:MAG: hypothetical protein JW776_04790 [Candidatus Lokiarchaeota archaeon]|nr:hypothetical protein [Candidatus Lokiarchaeota archaeon]
MFYKPKNLVPIKIPSNQNDVAPTMFFIDLIRSDQFQNPIIPVPSRIDKVTNGEYTAIVLPTNTPQVLKDDSIYFIDLYRFYKLGIRTLVVYSTKKYREICYKPLNPVTVSKWWSISRKYDCNIPTYREDLDFMLVTYIKAYIDFLNTGDCIGSLISYADKIISLCADRIKQNRIIYQMGNKIVQNRMYTERKDGMKIPQVWQIDRMDLKKNRIRKKAFVPLMVYDDLLECFLSNKAELERGELDAIPFSVLTQIKVLGNQPKTINENLNEIHLSNSKFDNILVEG